MEAAMKRIILLATLLILAVPFMATAKSYRIATVPWAGWSPVHVAQEKGFWKDQGLDIKVLNHQDIAQVYDFFKTKQVDITFFMMGTAVKWYTEGTPVTVLAETDWSHGGDKIIVRKGVDVKTLKGTPLGVYFDDPSIRFFLNKYLLATGNNISNFKVTEMEPKNLADNFIVKRFDIIVCFDPEAIRAAKEGNGEAIASTATYEGCMPEGMVMLKDVYKETPKEDLEKLLKGWVRAVKWTKDPANWKEYMTILNTVTFKGMDPLSEKDLTDMMGSVKIHDKTTQFERNKTGGGLTAFLEEMKAFFEANKMMKQDFSTADLFDNSVIMKVLQDEK